MRRQACSTTSICIAAALAGFGSIAQVQAQDSEVLYRAELLPLNAGITGSRGAGEVIYTIAGDQLTISVTAKEVPSRIEHWQHFHGFAGGGQAASCPAVDADKNGDGIIDVTETEPVSGTTMVPFHDDPVSMEVVRDTYPTADARGSYTYTKTVSLSALEGSFAPMFGGQQLDLERRVVFLHGVPASFTLPASVASLGDIPAHVTLPIACGEVRKVDG
jgi:hypothetical protein